MFGLEDELYDKIRELKSQNKELIDLIKEVSTIIDESEHWWMDCPNRGGFDNEKLKEVINKYNENGK